MEASETTTTLTNTMNKITQMPETLICCPIDSSNRQLQAIKRTDGTWLFTEAYTDQSNSTKILEVDEDLVETFERILAKRQSKLNTVV